MASRPLPLHPHSHSEGQGLVNLKNMLRIPLIGWADFLCVFNVFHGKMRLEQPLHPQVTSLAWEIDGETVETVADFILGGSKITADGDCSHEIKRHLLLGKKVATNLDSIFKSRGKRSPLH